MDLLIQKYASKTYFYISRRFVYKVKKALEKSHKFNIPFIIYETERDQTSMRKIEGKNKKFDLKGSYMSSMNENLDVFIEVKDYSFQGKFK